MNKAAIQECLQGVGWHGLEYESSLAKKHYSRIILLDVRAQPNYYSCQVRSKQNKLLNFTHYKWSGFEIYISPNHNTSSYRAQQTWDIAKSAPYLNKSLLSCPCIHSTSRIHSILLRTFLLRRLQRIITITSTQSFSVFREPPIQEMERHSSASLLTPFTECWQCTGTTHHQQLVCWK